MMDERVRIKGSRLKIWYRLLWILLTVISFRLFLMEDSGTAGIFYPLAMAVTGGAVCFWCARRHLSEKNKDYVKQMLWDMNQDDDCKDVVEAGKRWFLVNDRRKYWNMILVLLLMQGSGLLALYGFLHNVPFINYGFLALYGGIVLASLYFLKRCWRERLMEMLVKELRPLTAAAAFLMEALEGGAAGYPYAIAVHNAAVGLCRAGRYEAALGLAEACWEEKKNAFLGICHSNLRYVCLRNLNRIDEARQEADLQKKIMNENPGLQKSEGISAGIQTINIWETLGCNKREQAWTYTEAYLKQFKNDYYRLPILSIQVMIEEDRGRMEQMDAICRQILLYSSENIEVRRAMAYGRKSDYQESGHLFQDTVLDIVRFILSAAGVFVLCQLVLLCFEGI